MDIYIIVSVAFLFSYLFIGLYAGKQTKSVEDHLVMGRSATAIMITGTLIAANLSSVTFTGFTAVVATNGPLGLISQFGASVVASLFLGLYAGKYIYRMKLMTLPDFFAKRYPGKKTQTAAAFIVLISMTAYMITVMLGGVIVINSLFGWSTAVSLLVMMSVITVFTVVGGMRSVVTTEASMFFVFLLAALIIGPSVVLKAGGIQEAVTKAINDGFDYIFKYNGTLPKFNGAMNIIEMNILSFLNVLGAPHLLSRIGIAKSEREFGKAMLYLSIFLPFLIISLLYPFSYFPVLKTGVEPIISYVWVCKNLVPSLLGAIGIAGVVAAAISTATSLFQQASATLSASIIKGIFFPKLEGKKFLLVSRISVIAVAIVVYFCSLNPSISGATIMYAFLFATAAFGAWVPAIYLGLFWKKATTAGATWSMFITMPLIIVVAIARQKGIIPAWVPTNLVGLVCSTTLMVIISLCTKQKDGEALYNEIHAA